MSEIKLDFNDLLIVPKVLTDINTRASINPFTETGFLPIITAPMDTVVSENNINDFISNKICVCLPRNTINQQTIHSVFKSFSISEIRKLIDEDNVSDDYYLIDVANGHMGSVLNITKELKTKYPNIVLMVGNIANPETFGLLSDAGADYIRVGIGNGGGCLTTQQTGVGYPMASLIKECYDVSLTLKKSAYLVADGGMQTYSDIIKALALGADYVMLGSVLNKCLESSGENYVKLRTGAYSTFENYKTFVKNDFIVNQGDTFEDLLDRGYLYKKFRGMSTKEVQKEWNVGPLKTSEGVVKYNRVEYTLAQWVENFEAYLRSAMSYTGAHTLKEFIGQVELIQISDNAYKRFNK